MQSKLQISEVIRRHDIADGDNLDIPAEQTLFGDGPKNQPADPPKPIDCNFDCHGTGGIGSECDGGRGRREFGPH